MLFVLLGAWVLAARPRAQVNRALGLLLLLTAGSTVAFYRLRSAGSPEQTLFFLRVITWYELAVPLLVLLFVDGLFLRERRAHGRRWLLGVVGVLTAGMVLLHGFAPDWFHTLGPVPLEWKTVGVGGVSGGILAFVQGTLVAGAQAFAVVAAGWSLRDPEMNEVKATQAALVGLAFAFLLVNAGTASLSRILQRPSLVMDPPYEMIRWVWTVALVPVVLALPRLLGSLQRGGRWVSGLVVAGVVLGSLVDVGVVDVAGFASSDGASTRPVWLALFGSALSLAVIRYGLAGVSGIPPRRLRRATGAILILALAGAGAGVVLLYGGGTPTGLVTSVGIVGLVVALPMTPLRQAPRWLLDQLLLDPNEPEVARERVQVYRDALGNSRAENPHGESINDPALQALRDELGLTDRDHRLLVAALDDGTAEPDEEIYLGRYLAEETLGRGGTAEVFRARDTVLGRVVVLKVLHVEESSRRRSVVEGLALGRVQHRGVVEVYDVREAGDDVVLVLEHVDGGSLASHLAEGSKIEAEAALALVLDLLDALAAVHEAGIVHGDLKPDNVLMTRDGRPKIADFGSASLVHPDPDQTRTRAPSMVTPASMAPEQAAGEPPSAATDVYATASLLYHLLTGEPLIETEGASFEEIHRRVLGTRPDLDRTEIPDRLRPVLEDALARDPSHRYPDAVAFRAGLLDALGEDQEERGPLDPLEHEA